MEALAEMGIVSTGFESAGTSWTGVYEPRKRDPGIAEPRGEFENEQPTGCRRRPSRRPLE